MSAPQATARGARYQPPVALVILQGAIVGLGLVALSLVGNLVLGLLIVVVLVSAIGVLTDHGQQRAYRAGLDAQPIVIDGGRVEFAHSLDQRGSAALRPEHVARLRNGLAVNLVGGWRLDSHDIPLPKLTRLEHGELVVVLAHHEQHGPLPCTLSVRADAPLLPLDGS